MRRGANMSRVPELREIPELPDEIIQAARDGDLVLFVGAGVSMLLGLPSWKEMAWQQLEYLRKNSALNDSEIKQLGTLDPKKQLSIARELACDAELALDLTAGLTDHSEGNSIYKSINDIGCVCVTTNYDQLLTPRYTGTKGGSETPATTKRYYRKEDILMTHLDTPGTVVHLHGSVDDQETMIVTTKDYLEHYDDPLVKKFLGYLFEYKTVLFIGYRLEEAEILEHILRRGSVKDSAERRRFVLQGYYLSQSPLYESLHRYYRKSFDVHVIGYMRDHAGYRQQEAIFRDWVPKIIVNRPSLAADLKILKEVLSDG